MQKIRVFIKIHLKNFFCASDLEKLKFSYNQQINLIFSKIFDNRTSCNPFKSVPRLRIDSRIARAELEVG